jgi:hypothetical protein
MSTTRFTSPKVSPTQRVLLTLLLGFVGMVVTAGFIWMQTDPVIAPPGLRVLDWLWRVFVCRCPA